MSKQFEQRKIRMEAMLSSGEPSQKRDGKKRQRTRREKVDRYQRNLTTSPQGKAREGWNYYPDEKKAYIS